jgi:hypothetical protein
MSPTHEGLVNSLAVGSGNKDGKLENEHCGFQDLSLPRAKKFAEERLSQPEGNCYSNSSPRLSPNSVHAPNTSAWYVLVQSEHDRTILRKQ